MSATEQQYDLNRWAIWTMCYKLHIVINDHYVWMSFLIDKVVKCEKITADPSYGWNTFLFPVSLLLMQHKQKHYKQG